MRVTIESIARQLNVSPATVSRVLNNRESAYISEATRQRVRTVATEMGYRPNRAARALVTGRTHVIGVWAHATSVPYVARTLYQAEKYTRAAGYETIVGPFPNVHAAGVQDTLLAQWPVDGILAFEWFDTVEAYLDYNPGFHTPIVSFGAYTTARTDSVKVDYYPGALEAIRHLVGAGCRRILYAVNEWGNGMHEGRFRAYVETMQAAGLSPEFVVMQDTHRAEARQGLKNYVAAKGCPDGIFFLCDDMAIGGYRALCDLGLRAPKDVLLVGCDNIEDTEYLECPLSTIEPPVDALCAQAWQLLQARMIDPERPLQHCVLPSHLLIRESSSR